MRGGLWRIDSDVRRGRTAASMPKPMVVGSMPWSGEISPNKSPFGRDAGNGGGAGEEIRAARGDVGDRLDADFEACVFPPTASDAGVAVRDWGFPMRLAKELGLLAGGIPWLRFADVFGSVALCPVCPVLEVLFPVPARERAAVDGRAARVLDFERADDDDAEAPVDPKGAGMDEPPGVLNWSKQIGRAHV